MSVAFDVVIPTLGRPQLARLLGTLGTLDGPRPERVYIVADGGSLDARTVFAHTGWIAARAEIATTAPDGRPRGPACARNIGWKRAQSPWIVFLDDDVVPPAHWLHLMARDLERVDGNELVAGTTGHVYVPLPADRRPTDWERDVSGLQDATWITADIAYRREVLAALGGFDEGFPGAYREDADFALRVHESGYDIIPGIRRIEHPVRPAGFWVSVHRQRGNAADARMRTKHGARWRERAHVPRGRLPLHVLTTAAALLLCTRRRRLAAVLWSILTAEFAWRRIAPGPRTPAEIVRMVVTSACIPPLAVWHRIRGELRERRIALDVVFLDRDGTLVVDVPYNGDPDRVEPVADAERALTRLRAHGIKVAVVSNQSGIARGLLTHADVRAVNARIDALLGPFAGWWYCPHAEHDGCDCRKPAPGLITNALTHLGARARRCALIGDTAADVDAARAAGMRGILVPNNATRREEIMCASDISPSLDTAARRLVGADR